VADDDRAVREKLAALEAEVRADTEAQRARKEAALAKVREQRAAAAAALVPVKKPREPAPEREDHDDDDRGIGGALELATKANKVKQELQRKPNKGEKSWVTSGVASLALGPIGWLYAGSFREAIPAAAAYLAVAALVSKILPSFLLLPIMMVILPLSALAGVVYAIQYNRHGGRQRLFDKGDKSDKKQLKAGDDKKSR
jgi:hypothetical protein